MGQKLAISNQSGETNEATGPRVAHILGPFHLPLTAALQAILVILMVHRGWTAWDHRVIGVRGDPSIYVWFLSWWGYAIGHGLNLGTTHLITYPWGNNVLWDTAVPLVFIPLSLIVNAHLATLPMAYNLATFGGWWFSGIAAYWSFFTITRRRLGSLAGSLMMLTSAYYTNQALGHTDLMWVGFAFLLFGAAHRYESSPSLPAVWMVWRAVALDVCLWLTNQEYFVTTQIMMAVGIAFLAHDAVVGRRSWLRVGRLVKGYGAGLALTAIVLAPLIIWQMTTPDQPWHPFSYIDVYQVNLANLVIPVHTVLHWGSATLTGNVMEQDGYLGAVALVGLIAASVVTWRRNQGKHRLLIYWTGLLLVISMGDFFLIDAAQNTHIPGPGIILTELPVLKDIIFNRFMWGVFWGIGLLTALYYDGLRSRSGRLVWLLWSVLVMTSWWPSGYPTQALSSNPWITAAVNRGAIPRGAVVLEFPYDILFNPNNNVMDTQTANHFRYRLAEGYLSPNDAILKNYDALVSFWVTVQTYGPQSQSARYYRAKLGSPGRVFHEFLARTHPEVTVLAPMAHQSYMKRWLTRYLGTPSGHRDQTYWWFVPRRH